MFKKPFSFNGRIRRLEYGISFIIGCIVSELFGYTLGYIAGTLINNGYGNQSLYYFLTFILYLPSIGWFFVAQGTKRCHDLGNSGWWQFIPFYVIWLIFQRGQDGENKYGKNPKSIDNAKEEGSVLISQTESHGTNLTDSREEKLENKEISVTPTLDFDQMRNDAIDKAKAKGIDPDVVDGAFKNIRDYFEKATRDSNDRSMLLDSLHQLGVDLNGGTLISHVIADDEKKPVSNTPSLDDSEEKLTSSNVTETEVKDKLRNHFLKKTQVKRSSLISIIIGLSVMVLLITYFFSQNSVSNSYNSRSNVYKELIVISDSINMNCPIPIDRLTTLENTAVVPPKTLIINDQIGIDMSNWPIDELKSQLRSTMLNSIKTNPAMKELTDNSVTFDYVYSDANGNFLFSLEFTPNDYK